MQFSSKREALAIALSIFNDYDAQRAVMSSKRAQLVEQNENCKIAAELYGEDSREFMSELVKEFSVYRELCSVNASALYIELEARQILGAQWRKLYSKKSQIQAYFGNMNLRCAVRYMGVR